MQHSKLNEVVTQNCILPKKSTKKNVVDIRNIGLVAGVELATREDGLTKRAYDVFDWCFNEGLMVRFTGETICVSPPLIVNEEQIEQIFETIQEAIISVK